MEQLGIQFREEFLRQPICSHILGFHITKFPLWKLGNLLGETWVEEDVMNAIAELTYFTAATFSSGSPNTTPAYLYLPTHFFSDASRLYQQDSKTYSSELVAL